MAIDITKYKAARDIIKPLIGKSKTFDALSAVEFYLDGLVECPVTSIETLHNFLPHNIENQWMYYCCHPELTYTNSFIALPSPRTRALGYQLYKYNIKGFLHWGYNFYNSCPSRTQLDPFGNPDGGYFTPSGDCFLVYPGMDGNAWESMRLNALREAVDDMRALSLYEEKFGREAAEKLLLEDVDGKLTFKEYPTDRMFLINLREKIAKAFL